jgi:hypothetical protein
LPYHVCKRRWRFGGSHPDGHRKKNRAMRAFMDSHLQRATQPPPSPPIAHTPELYHVYQPTPTHPPLPYQSLARPALNHTHARVRHEHKRAHALIQTPDRALLLPVPRPQPPLRPLPPRNRALLQVDGRIMNGLSFHRRVHWHPHARQSAERLGSPTRSILAHSVA